VAIWDSADLLARCKVHAHRPATDKATTDANWYSLLEEAQVDEYQNFATHVPHVLYGAPTALSTADGGITYTFPGAVFPFGSVEVYQSLTLPPLVEGAFWDPAADYIFEGDKIRMTRNKARTFSDGPYARFITPPGAIAAGTQPTLEPPFARILLVHRAVAMWAERGGFRSSTQYWNTWTRKWYGNPDKGEFGILGMLKNQSAFAGGAAIPSTQSLTGLEFIDTGSGYTPA
jgi:hypothetical protein